MKETEEEKIKNKNNVKLSHFFAVFGLVFSIVSLIILIFIKYLELYMKRRYGNGTLPRIFYTETAKDTKTTIPKTTTPETTTQETNTPKTNT